MSKRQPLESSIENAFVERAVYLGAITRKLNGLGYVSWPDRWVLPPGRRNLDYLIEFKRPGEKPTKLQASLHLELADRGLDTFVFDSWQAALDHYVARTNIGLTPLQKDRLYQRLAEVKSGKYKAKKKKPAAYVR